MALIDLNAAYAAQNKADNASKKTMIYQFDDGTLTPVEIEENIGEAFGFADFTGAETTVDVAKLYKRWEMRRIYYSDGANISGSFPVGSPSFGAYVEGGSVTVARKGKADGVLCPFTGTVGEKKTFRNPADTGQLSGDLT